MAPSPLSRLRNAPRQTPLSGRGFETWSPCGNIVKRLMEAPFNGNSPPSPAGFCVLLWPVNRDLARGGNEHPIQDRCRLFGEASSILYRAAPPRRSSPNSRLTFAASDRRRPKLNCQSRMPGASRQSVLEAQRHWPCRRDAHAQQIGEVDDAVYAVMTDVPVTKSEPCRRHPAGSPASQRAYRHVAVSPVRSSLPQCLRQISLRQDHRSIVTGAAKQDVALVGVAIIRQNLP